MKALTLLLTGNLVFALTTTQLVAQMVDRADVERAQKALRQVGHDPGPIDGVMGAKTAGAVRAYQKAHGLSETGQLDEATVAKLGEAAETPSASPKTGGDTKPTAVDPSQATKTGANAGEGASYSRSTEKGQSTVSDAVQEK